MKPESLDRRLFLRGLMLTSAGLVVPKSPSIFVPPAFVGGHPEILHVHVTEMFKAERIFIPDTLFPIWIAWVASHPDFHKQSIYGKFSEPNQKTCLYTNEKF